mgnify:CR=1 FL=1
MQTNNTKIQKPNGKNLKIAIVLPYFNEKLGLELLKNAKEELLKNNVQEKNIAIIRVAGALEIPFACKKIIGKMKPDAIIALGVVIHGETSHFELVTNTTYQGLMKVQLDTGIPISFGILACENIGQAKKRINKGREAAQAALLQTPSEFFLSA